MASPRSGQLTTEGKGFSDKTNTWAKAWRCEGKFEITKKKCVPVRLGIGWRRVMEGGTERDRVGARERGRNEVLRDL